jgi:hypothetical protein
MTESSRLSTKILDRLVNALTIMAVLVCLSAMFLFVHYDDTRPTLKQPAEGRVYPWSNHGHVVYLTQKEQLQLYILGGIGGGLFVGAVCTSYSAKLRQGRNNA